MRQIFYQYIWWNTKIWGIYAIVILMHLKSRSDKCPPNITDIQLLLPQSRGVNQKIFRRVFHSSTEILTVVYNYHGLLLPISYRCPFVFCLWSVDCTDPCCTEIHGCSRRHDLQINQAQPCFARVIIRICLLDSLSPHTSEQLGCYIYKRERAELLRWGKDIRWTQRRWFSVYLYTGVLMQITLQ